ncbi:hypothetical protein O9993_18060 [Vibrio lentus]|nr:hypothetical protein [Vibrio lentus]
MRSASNGPLQITVRSVDTDADSTEYLGTSTSFDVDLVIDLSISHRHL